MPRAAGARLATRHMRRRLSTAHHLPTLAPAVPHQCSTAQHRAATCHSHKAFCGPLNTGYVPAVQRNKFSVLIDAGSEPAGKYFSGAMKATIAVGASSAVPYTHPKLPTKKKV